ncbi:cardiolipin synthase [Lacticaseibacillus pantheris DSM 15945 = JCM 12539 = NBRC 106106]|uniref:Cardiolipin synthase n=1 Tax=Lacticaseibacillus pantheris DSM 15945 = JCM 12539 = NBRC 106106 TaxID=1423783 RepID=A0A0R1U1S8_9LACO|nr:cardiolipin synthase [Lacticaseibacillus pantheris]KRL87344.1 cardiolipin synthase [Lacticaseibacillus pantheris DSM 15945 = JCM 12539 = NBRC 106106]
MQIVNWIILAIVLLDWVAAIITVFHSPRNIAATWAWLLVLVVIPVFGFILYLFTGRGLGNTKLFRLRTADRIGLKEIIDAQRSTLPRLKRTDTDEITQHRAATVEMFRQLDNAPLIRRNAVEIITDGNDKFARMFADIKAAKHSIHIEYYTFYSDKIGTQLRDLLVQKAQEGVDVRVVYDAFGSHGTTNHWFKPLHDAGGKTIPFVTSRNAVVSFRLNYHDHRKIVVIDGKIGYTGGFNVGDQYLGRAPKFGYWRDTHLRIIGHGVQLLQVRFIMDWNSSVNQTDRLTYDLKYFPAPDKEISGTTSMQLVTSGPDSTTEQIKLGYIKLINAARRRVWIQSPYLVPDDAVITALRIAAAAGIDVRIMIPCMPDHPFIYRATQYYANYLHQFGIKVYIYNNGFLHAKTMLIDDDMASVGSANQDFRSYSLNFEVNTFMYDHSIVRQLADIFQSDMEESTELTDKMIDAQGRWLRFKQLFSRLLSPVL